MLLAKFWLSNFPNIWFVRIEALNLPSSSEPMMDIDAIENYFFIV